VTGRVLGRAREPEWPPAADRPPTLTFTLSVGLHVQHRRQHEGGPVFPAIVTVQPDANARALTYNVYLSDRRPWWKCAVRALSRRNPR
jgi:hypothetical protein